MSNPFIGEIRMFSFAFPPKGWMSCAGQLLPINQYQALFSLLGTTYGGNGQTNFALPDLRSRTPIHFGTGPGLSSRVQGQAGGEENHTLSTAEMPSHVHSLQAATTATSKTAAGGELAQNASKLFRSGSTPNLPLPPTTLAATGGNLPHPNMQPYAVVNFSIALVGIFPSRN